MRVLKVCFVLFTAMLTMTVTCVWIAGCDDKPTEPEPPEPEDYVVYAKGGSSPGQYFAYHTHSERLDTFMVDLPWPSGLAVSADGERLYICTDPITVLNTADYSIHSQLPYTGNVVVSPDNKHIAIESNSDLYILSTSDYSLVCHDTDHVRHGAFSQNGKRYYSHAGAVDCQYVYCIDLEAAFMAHRTCLPGTYSIWLVRPSIDENHWFVYRYYGNYHYGFEVYDVAADSAVFLYGPMAGYGDMVVSPDGNHVYFTAPGDLHHWLIPFATFAIYDISQMSLDTVIVWSLCNQDNSTGIIGAGLAIAPNNKLLVCLEAYVAGRRRMVIYDLVNGDTAAVFCSPVGGSYHHITCQNSL